MSRRAVEEKPPSPPLTVSGTVAFLAAFERVMQLLSQVVAWAGIVGSIYAAGYWLSRMKGTQTAVAVSLKARVDTGGGTDINPYLLASVIVLLATLLWSRWSNWRLRRRYEDDKRRLTADKEVLERIVDPQRSSSGLTRLGRTNPDDE